MQEFKRHPYVASLLEGGTIHSYGAKAISEGGYYSVPRLSWPAGLHCGESGGVPELGALEGVHLAMKSGMLAAETAFDRPGKGGLRRRGDGRLNDEPSADLLDLVELYKVRNFHQGFERASSWEWRTRAAARDERAGVREPPEWRPGHAHMKKVAEAHVRPVSLEETSSATTTRTRSRR